MPSQKIPLAFALAVVCFSAAHSAHVARAITEQSTYSAESADSSYSAGSSRSSSGALSRRDAPAGRYRRSTRQRDDLGVKVVVESQNP
jgi:opacity protein-like surface antigen